MSSLTIGSLDWKHWALSHLIWIVLAVAVLIGFRSWRQEHDAYLIAAQQIKVSEAQVSNLESQIKQRDQQTAQVVAPIVKIIHDVQTVPQAVAALPQVVNQPLPVPVVQQPDNSVLIPQPDVLPLFQQVADDKVCRVQLDAATKDLTDTKAIVVQKNDEIAALKKPKGFWKRAIGTVKTGATVLGIGIAIGVRLAK